MILISYIKTNDINIINKFFNKKLLYLIQNKIYMLPKINKEAASSIFFPKYNIDYTKKFDTARRFMTLTEYHKCSTYYIESFD